MIIQSTLNMRKELMENECNKLGRSVLVSQGNNSKLIQSHEMARLIYFGAKRKWPIQSVCA